MSKQANPFRIGLFVIGAVTMACVALLVFGSGKLFNERFEYVMFFDSSVNGLTDGAAVVLHGVPVGRVTKIRIDGSVQDQLYKVPVFIEIYPKRFNFGAYVSPTVEQRIAYLKQLVKKGFRARLAQQSILTGQLMIELMFVNVHAKDYSPAEVAIYDGLPVVPTINSRIDTMIRQLSDIDFGNIGKGIDEAVESVNSMLRTSEMRNLPMKVARLVDNANSVAETVNVMLRTPEVQALPTKVVALVDNIDRTLATYERTGENVGELAERLKDDLSKTMGALLEVVDPVGSNMVRVGQLTAELTAMARSMRQLTDLLYRNPQALIGGKGAR